jgi:hypothetical protein
MTSCVFCLLAAKNLLPSTFLLLTFHFYLIFPAGKRRGFGIFYPRTEVRGFTTPSGVVLPI